MNQEIKPVTSASVEQMLAWAAKQPQAVHCRLCGQELTDPVSIARGIGPICIDKEEEGAS